MTGQDWSGQVRTGLEWARLVMWSGMVTTGQDWLDMVRKGQDCIHENIWKHRQHASGTKKIKVRNKRDMAYLELKIVDKACINHQKRALITPFFINSLLIEA